MFNEIKECRGCHSQYLTDIMNLGDFYLTGVFPRHKNAPLTKGPLELVLCDECKLLQLKNSYDLNELYGKNYGYRSGLNRSMMEHLRNKVSYLSKFVSFEDDDIVLDVGSNDGTTLNCYPETLRRVGIDPTAEKFRRYYKDSIVVLEDFFSADAFRALFGKDKAKIITSIAMFYDLEDPQSFVADIASILASDGIWHFEQSYMPMMLQMNAYDTICHEHLEYYGLAQVKRMLDVAGLKIIDVFFNDVNGGSFGVTAAHRNAPQNEASEAVRKILSKENSLQLDSLVPYRAFEKRVLSLRDELVLQLQEWKENGTLVLGYGASTKGNVVLQYCGISEEEMPCIAEVNEDKFGCFTPGTNIPIVSEQEAKALKPDVFLVLPWHFKKSILEREKGFISAGGGFCFPLPVLSFNGNEEVGRVSR